RYFVRGRREGQHEPFDRLGGKQLTEIVVKSPRGRLWTSTGAFPASSIPSPGSAPPPAFQAPAFQCGIHSAPTTASEMFPKFTPSQAAQSPAVSGFPSFRPAERSGI